MAAWISNSPWPPQAWSGRSGSKSPAGNARPARLVLELCRFLVENTATCRHARLASVAPQLGLRSGGRIQGRCQIGGRGRARQPEARRLAWPAVAGRWSAGGDDVRPEMAFFSERDYYEIPLDCLRPAGLDNLFAAGRCFSAATGAMTSARVIGTALATGWAAGTAAAFQALDRPLDRAVETIRRQMNE